MIESIEFKNFKALRDTTLQLSRFTLIVGANGSGKSSALQSILALAHGGSGQWHLSRVRTVGAPQVESVTLTARWKQEKNGFRITYGWNERFAGGTGVHFKRDEQNTSPDANKPRAALARARLFSLDANAIAAPVQLEPQMELAPNGANLAGVLDRLRDQSPERFEDLNEQLGKWIPEFDKILFETPGQGCRSLALRTRQGGHAIKASDLSQGTLIALALLTIAYQPEPPSIVCLEEPDHGLHPRLLRDVRDALYRLAYPEGSQEKRDPVQVIATTHNPYFLDLFRDHPEEIVIAEKVGMEAKFSRLSDRADLEEILGDAPLSEVWYSGVLGGVPTGT
jgi:predicted ATPase